MSFYKITDPEERRRMFEKLAQTRKNVREHFLEDKIGQLESSETLKTFFKPVTESQRELREDIKEQLTPIRNVITAQIPTKALPTLTEEDLEKIGPIAAEYFRIFLGSDREVDKTFGLYSDDSGRTWKIGNKTVTVDGDDFIIEGNRYPGTQGLWELVVKDKPSEQKFNDDDLKTYSEILVKTNAMRRNNDPDNPRPKSSGSFKWNNVVKEIWNKNKKDEYEGQGINTVVIPSDPNALIERLDLLMASKEAGNTGTRNEIVSICDELLRQKIVNKNAYKNIMLRL